MLEKKSIAYGAATLAVAALVVTILVTGPSGSPVPVIATDPAPPTLPDKPLRTSLSTDACDTETLRPRHFYFGPVWDCTYLRTIREAARGDASTGLNGWEPTTSLNRWPEISVNNRYRVTGINITTDHGLSGTLSPYLARLDYVTSLTISNNDLTGPVSAYIGLMGSKASGLTYIDLSGNEFTGPIPDALRAHKRLAHLDLSDNNLSGEVPEWIFDLTHYDLSGNEDLVLAGSDTIVLTSISDGATDAVTLEWRGAPTGATAWQYRVSSYSEEMRRRGSWSAWKDMAGVTTSYRVTGLKPDTGYYFEVRATGKGGIYTYPSNTSISDTQSEMGPARIGRDVVVEGDGTTEWRIYGVGWVVTLPDGLRVEAGGGGILENGGVGGVGIWDVKTGSYLIFNVFTGSEVERHVESTTAGGDSDDEEPSLDTLFDQIVESVRVSW